MLLLLSCCCPVIVRVACEGGKPFGLVSQQLSCLQSSIVMLKMFDVVQSGQMAAMFNMSRLSAVFSVWPMFAAHQCALVIKALLWCAGVLTLQREQDIAYGVTLVWSLIAIYYKQWPITIIRIVSLGGLLVLTVSIVLAIVQRLKQRKYSPVHNNDLEESLQS